jgi:hypothetical protein
VWLAAGLVPSPGWFIVGASLAPVYPRFIVISQLFHINWATFRMKFCFQSLDGLVSCGSCGMCLCSEALLCSCHVTWSCTVWWVGPKLSFIQCVWSPQDFLSAVIKRFLPLIK